MASLYYSRSDHVGPTITVRELIKRLTSLEDHNLPVIFKSPQCGVYGSGIEYSIDKVSVVELPAEDFNWGKQKHYDEDTDKVTIADEDYIQHFHAWKGVVIE